MRAIKEARKYIERKPKDAQAKTLSRLVLALESEAPFPITELYQLDMDRFTLALQILEEWRLDRYYASKARLLDVSLRLADLSKPQKATKATKAKPGAATPSKPKAKPAAKPASKSTAKSTPKSTPKSAAKPASKANTKTTAKDAGKKKTERKKTAKR